MNKRYYVFLNLRDHWLLKNKGFVVRLLVESFYKAGISSEIILSTVNKILTFSKEDNFTAMDLGIVNLFDGSADFIKIGVPSLLG